MSAFPSGSNRCSALKDPSTTFIFQSGSQTLWISEMWLREVRSSNRRTCRLRLRGRIRMGCSCVEAKKEESMQIKTRGKMKLYPLFGVRELGLRDPESHLDRVVHAFLSIGEAVAARW